MDRTLRMNKLQTKYNLRGNGSRGRGIEKSMKRRLFCLMDSYSSSIHDQHFGPEKVKESNRSCTTDFPGSLESALAFASRKRTCTSWVRSTDSAVEILRATSWLYFLSFASQVVADRPKPSLWTMTYRPEPSSSPIMTGW